MSHEYEFISFEVSLLTDAKFIPNLTLHTTQKDYKCLKIAKCSKFIPKHKLMTGKAGFIQIVFGCQVW